MRQPGRSRQCLFGEGITHEVGSSTGILTGATDFTN
jgi:hypothetical protein